MTVDGSQKVTRATELRTALDGCVAARLMQQALEGASELHVEDGVDDRIEKAVDVAEPDEERQEVRVGATDCQRVEEVVAQADRTDDIVEREERNPAEQEHTCEQIADDR